MVLCRIVAIVKPFSNITVLTERQANSDEGAVVSTNAANPNSRIVAQTDGSVIGKDVDDCKSRFILANAAEINQAMSEGDVSYTIERVS